MTQAPCIDFSSQLRLSGKDYVVQAIIRLLKTMAHEVSAGKIDSIGAIVVLGSFAQNNGVVPGMVQMKPQSNPINSYVRVEDDNALTLFREFSAAPYDGAIVVERTGQIIGAGVYLDIEHPAMELPPDCGTRHKAAASFSTRDDVTAVFTLSEESNIIRVWQDGKPIEELLF